MPSQERQRERPRRPDPAGGSGDGTGARIRRASREGPGDAPGQAGGRPGASPGQAGGRPAASRPASPAALRDEAPACADPMRVWFRFVRLNRRLSSAMAAGLRELGLSIPQFDVISTLTEREGLTQKELARRLYVTKGNVSGLIDRLVEAGLVERRALPGDRRSHALYLTADGSRLAGEGMRIQRCYVERTLGTFARADLDALEDAIVRWRDAVRDAEES